MNTSMTAEKSTPNLDKLNEDRAGRNLESDIDGLRSQVESMVEDVARLGRRGLRTARAGAAQGIDAIGRTSESMAENVGRELANVEGRAVDAVRERPLQSLALALAAGALLAFLLRR